ncbi:MAG: AAA family ATPase [Armatimonadetes bacterium]|nr:AAA family ATPase [Armatimonadota bacterium]
MSKNIITPFDRNQDMPLFESAGHQEAFARLQLMVKNNYLGVLTGEVGSGKSTLIRHLVHGIDHMSYQPVYLSIAGLKPRDFYSEMLHHLGETAPFSLVKAKRLWEEVLEARHKQGDKTLVVIIDEAHELSQAMILELRLVMNHRMDSVSFFPLILVGQPELRRILRLKKYEAVSQRIGLRYHLGGMTRDETAAYIRHRIKAAGLDKPLFSEGAIRMIYSATQGIPRPINHICSQALYDAGCKGHEVIEESHISRVLADMERQRGTAG